MYQRNHAATVVIKRGVIKMDDEYPCDNCSIKEWCDGWEAQFCCQLCMYLYDGEPNCKDCDPMDI